MESRDAISAALQGVSHLILLCGLGGGTGGGATPVIAALAREKGIFTFAVATIPFFFEGKKRKAVAEGALEKLGSCTDCCIAVNCDCTVGEPKENRTFQEMLRLMDEFESNIIAELLPLVSSIHKDHALADSCQSFLAPLRDTATRFLGEDTFLLSKETIHDQENTSFRWLIKPKSRHWGAGFNPKPVVHPPGPEEFIFDEDEIDMPSFWRGKTAGDDARIWFNTPLPPKDPSSSIVPKKKDNTVVIQFPGKSPKK